MLTIRLARKGRKKRPTYRIVLQEREWAPSSKVIENLGHMNPHTDPSTVVLEEERIKYWIDQGAQTSSTVHNILVTAGVITEPKRRSVFGKKKGGEENSEEATKEKPAEEPKKEEEKAETEATAS
ncbi:MAG: 30S ribosomal protein S16 [bacterium]|nr:30S ribosomal protein S16 [bacterium]